ncbi:DUF6541 family protein [Pseudonocardia halophobica]|uniref:DUF6541 family protein n=1 Tax=Pseudonocardia halophobica TaxID=29401 RepID=UPI003D95016B
MAAPVVDGSDLGLVVVYALALFLPGGIVGLAARLRGWCLAATAPLLTYALVGLLGPWTTALGVRWSAGVLVVGTLLVAVVLAGLDRLLARWRSAPTVTTTWPTPLAAWSPRAHLAVAAVVGVAALAGAQVVIGGMRGLRTIPQDWDAVFHASGIRWIAERGDAGLFGMSQINWFEPGTSIFYPNAYHILGATVLQLTGRDVPSVLNAHTALIPGLCALVLAALVRRFGGTPTHAAATALAAVAASALYDMLWRGPLLPYATGVALTPAFLLLVVHLLDSLSLRQATVRGLVAALGAAGLVCLHPAMLFGVVVLVVPCLIQRWATRPERLRREPLVLAGTTLAALALVSSQIAGSLHSAASFPAVDWPADLAWSESITEILSFGHAAPWPQMWLVAPAVVGLLTYNRLGALRWIGAPIVVFGALFVLAASSDAEWVNAVTRPWWNDRWRLAALFTLLACVLVGHGVDRIAALLARLSRWLFRDSAGRLAEGSGAVTAFIALVAFVALSHGLYLERNETKMSINTGQGPALSSLEVTGLSALGSLVPRGVRVLNDRNDGSVWMYALSGTLPVAGHYDGTGLGNTDVSTLETAFNLYDERPDVRAAVSRLGVGYVVVGEGFLRSYSDRAPGLTNLDDLPFLRLVYANPDFRVYRIVAPDGD